MTNNYMEKLISKIYYIYKKLQPLHLFIKNIYIYFNQSDYLVEFKIYPNVAYIVEDMKNR